MQQKNQILKLSKIWQHGRQNLTTTVTMRAFSGISQFWTAHNHRLQSIPPSLDTPRPQWWRWRSLLQHWWVDGQVEISSKKWYFQQKRLTFLMFLVKMPMLSHVFFWYEQSSQKQFDWGPTKKICGLWDLSTKILVPYVALLFHRALRFEKTWLDEKQRIHQIVIFWNHCNSKPKYQQKVYPSGWIWNFYEFPEDSHSLLDYQKKQRSLVTIGFEWNCGSQTLCRQPQLTCVIRCGNLAKKCCGDWRIVKQSK